VLLKFGLNDLNPVLALSLTEAQWFGVLMIGVGLWQLLTVRRAKKVATT
jgi:hypothetical protein